MCVWWMISIFDIRLEVERLDTYVKSLSGGTSEVESQ